MADDLAGFELALDRLGPALERWPDGERRAAERLLAREPAARSLLAESQRLEALLRAALPAELPARLQARLASLPASHPRAAGGWLAFLSGGRLAWGAGVAALAASAVLGFIVGSSGLPLAAADDDTPELASLAFAPQLEAGDDQ